MLADKDGKITLSYTDTSAKLSGDQTLIGKSLVFHQDVDDLGKGTGAAKEESLKTGNAGPRVACCVITAVDPLAGMKTAVSSLVSMAAAAYMLF